MKRTNVIQISAMPNMAMIFHPSDSTLQIEKIEPIVGIALMEDGDFSWLIGSKDGSQHIRCAEGMKKADDDEVSVVPVSPQEYQAIYLGDWKSVATRLIDYWAEQTSDE